MSCPPIEHRCFELADNPIVFKPQTDLAIQNYICNYIIQNGKVNQAFVDAHCNFKKTALDIGYGLRPNHPAGEGRHQQRLPRTRRTLTKKRGRPHGV